jgi:pimeloyl-ACP methyl ester carboxylesterase
MLANVKADYVKVGDGKLYYEIAGEGEPLVLVHAAFVDSGMWDTQWNEFAKHYQVIRFDMRGNGKSDKATKPVNRREELYQLLTELGIERGHILGCSMGGMTVIDFALEHPEMAKSLIAVSASPSGFELKGDMPPHLQEMMEAAQKGDVERTSELQIRIWVDGMYRKPNQVDPAVRKHAAAMNKIAVKNGTFGVADMKPLNPLNPPAVGRLKEIKVPTLVIAGALDHPEVVRAADVMAAEIKGAKKLIIQDAAHVPSMEKPAEFNRAVLDFLRGVK